MSYRDLDTLVVGDKVKIVNTRANPHIDVDNRSYATGIVEKVTKTTITVKQDGSTVIFRFLKRNGRETPPSSRYHPVFIIKFDAAEWEDLTLKAEQEWRCFQARQSIDTFSNLLYQGYKWEIPATRYEELSVLIETIVSEAKAKVEARGNKNR